MKKLEDVSLDYFEIKYRTADGKINKHFDDRIREDGKLFGLKFSGSGIEIETRIRDIKFVRK